MSENFGSQPTLCTDFAYGLHLFSHKAGTGLRAWAGTVSSWRPWAVVPLCAAVDDTKRLESRAKHDARNVGGVS